MKPVLKKVNLEIEFFDIIKAFSEEDELIVLESTLNDDNGARYSFLGVNPFIKFRSKDGTCTVNNYSYEADCFEELEKILFKYKSEYSGDIPFTSGGIGFFSYDLVNRIEKLPTSSTDDLDIQDCYFNFYDNIIIFDHLSGEVYISSLGILEHQELSVDNIENRLKKVIKSNIKNNNYLRKIDSSRVSSNFSRDEYLKAVDVVKDYIRSGDIYIMNLTQRLELSTDKDPLEVYTKLRHINPAPYASFMKLEGFSVVSSSPERFTKINRETIETKPIKGTRPRGSNELEDEKNKQELINSEKDKAELLMIIDLERNDLSKVCRPGTVKVKELYKLEKYSTVFHLVSTITGELKEGVTISDCLKACFPGGSITGAPKIRTMEIIDGIEGIKRGLYTGSIGYLDFNGNADLNIVIRTILMKQGKAYIGVGGGITWDSVNISEYDETLDKAKALLMALN